MVSADDHGDAEMHHTTKFIEPSTPSPNQSPRHTPSPNQNHLDQVNEGSNLMLKPSGRYPSIKRNNRGSGESLLSASRVIVDVDAKERKDGDVHGDSNTQMESFIPEEQIRENRYGYKNWLLRIRTMLRVEPKTVVIILLAVTSIIAALLIIRQHSVSSAGSSTNIHQQVPTQVSTVFGSITTTDGSVETIVTTTSSGKENKLHTKSPSTTTTSSTTSLPTTSLPTGHHESAVSRTTTGSPIVNNSIIITSTMKFPVTTKSDQEIFNNVTTSQKKKSGHVTMKTDEVVISSTISSESEKARKKFDEMMSTTMKTGQMFNMKKFVTENRGKMNYKIGVGRGDITGPAAEVGMMGYGNLDQNVNGIHTRLYARTFMIGDVVGGKPFLFINTDACMGASLLKLELLKKLKVIYGDKFTGDNICLTGTHTHSAPAGFLQDVLFQITSKGYIPQTLDTMVKGIMVSIKHAVASYAPGWIFMNKGELLNTNINRSPTAYASNPMSERKQYKYNVDKEMTLLKFVDKDGNDIGMINWFPVHCTSMNSSNTLISSDNKGYAELLFEQAMDPGSLIGESKFVAAFAQAHEGDVSPNIKGPRCIDTGLPCDAFKSTCGDAGVSTCIASGPGNDMFESTKIIGRNQYVKAMELYDSAEQQVKGPVTFIKQNINMTEQSVRYGNKTYRTCQPAMGYSFAAGTTDGPGVYNFKQGDTKGNTFWDNISKLLKTASKEQKDCHYPKPILIDSGEMTKPYEWQPKVVETQILRIGNLIINAIPAEFTTMSGRRLIKAVKKVMEKNLPDEDFEIVIAGLSNAYSDYVATYEEYKVQRYEGASTIYGPFTLQAYIQQYQKLADALTKGDKLPPGPEIHNLRDQLFALQMGVVYDRAPFRKDYGDVYIDAKPEYNVGEEVMVEFVSAHPKNSYGENIEQLTFLKVERLINQTWVIVHTDADWCTKFVWSRERSSFGDTSEAKIFWKIPLSTPEGIYRIRHFGHRKFIKVYSFEGTSKTFRVFNRNNQ